MSKILAVRFLLWYYLVIHAWLWWQQSVNVLLLSFFMAISFLYFNNLPKTFSYRRQAAVRWLLPVIALTVLRCLVILIEALFFRHQPLLLAYFDLTFYPALFIILLVALDAFLLRRSFFPANYEIFLRFIALIFVFWATKGYQIEFYNHPVNIIVSLAGYFMGEVLLLMLESMKNYPLKKQLRRIGVNIFCLLPLFLIMPLVFTGVSAEMTQSGGGLLKPTLSSFDFSKVVQLENEIDLGTDLVLILKTSRPLTKKTLFKRYTLAYYDEAVGFKQIDGYGELEKLPLYPIEIRQKEPLSRTSLEQEIYLINLDKDALVGANLVHEVIPYKNWNKTSFKRVYKVNSFIMDDYPVEELRSVATFDQLSQAEKQIYLKPGDNTRLKELAEQITLGLTSNFDKAMAINSFLKDNYYYSLNPGIALSGNKINHFLFESQKGYCSYFAFSMSLMLRSLGIPSRVATGFWADASLENGGYYPISSELAHAWVEVFFDDYGWISFDPTSDRQEFSELGTAKDSADINKINQLLDEIRRNRADLIPLANDLQDFLPPEAGDTENGLSLIVRENIIKLITLVTVLFLMSYLLIVFLHDKLWRYSARHKERQNIIKLTQYYYYYYQMNEKLLSFKEFMDREPQIAAWHRKALYAPHFSEQDYTDASNLWAEHMAAWRKQQASYRWLGRWLSPRRFFVRRKKNEH